MCKIKYTCYDCANLSYGVSDNELYEYMSCCDNSWCITDGESAEDSEPCDKFILWEGYKR
jgi:hypothetical protein